MPDVVGRFVEHRAAQLVVAAAAGDQEMTHTPAPRGDACGALVLFRDKGSRPVDVRQLGYSGDKSGYLLA